MSARRRTRAIAVIIGTRPEAIKMAPIVREIERRSRKGAGLAARVVLTAQHRELSDDVLRIFRIRPAYDLDIMRPKQSLFDTTTAVLSGLERVFARERPAAVLVQGDTTSTFAGALAAFYLRLPVGHVEAGLRTYDRWNPFPEEMNRRLTSGLADWHFAPTARACAALLAEGVPAERVHVTGNPVVDALRAIARRTPRRPPAALAGLDPARVRLVLVTLHRRENWGRPLRELAGALADIVAGDRRAQVIFPVHPNPNVSGTVRPILEKVKRVRLVAPMNYVDFVQVMARATLIITDSGGVQEEAPSLGVPVLVARRTSERPEGVEAGMVRLVGTSRRRMAAEALRLLASPAERRRMMKGENPYGDGHAARRIVDILEREVSA